MADTQLKWTFPAPETPLANFCQGKQPWLCFGVESLDRKYNQICLKVHKDQPKDLPEFYTTFEAHKFKNYQQFFDSSVEFRNPNCADLIYQELDLDITEHYTNMANARGRYPPQEYADEIRQKQASKLAFR